MKRLKKIPALLMTVTAMSLLFSGTALARHGHGHFRGSIWIGPGFWPAFPYYSEPYYVQPPPVVIRQAPEEYIHKAPEVEEPYYWYYCRKPEGYYPYVRTCPDGWMKVLPSQTPPDAKE
jgi:hypothetical protein